MIDGWTIVLDVGKTNAKLSLWDEQGRLLEQWVRANEPRLASGYRALDVEGIDAWLLTTLAACARMGPVRRIVPVGHGAAAAILREGRLHVDPVDYEEPVDEAERLAYLAERDPFDVTGSPFLPAALNLGLQLHLVERLHGTLPGDASILPWPQFWAWRLSGVPASEVTSLGCHSDLWRPLEARFSDLATRRGWAERMAPLRRAHEVLGVIGERVATATGLARDCEVLCGLHDSNAALLALKGHAEIADRDATVLSTGTWFVAMRSMAEPDASRIDRLDEDRDCLINVDVHGRPVPSARFMGGREAALMQGEHAFARAAEPPAALLERLPALLASDCRAYPSFVQGTGPFPHSRGRLVNAAADARDLALVASLYLALMTDTMLDLIGSADTLFIEGPFALDTVFVRALATLRPTQTVYVSDARHALAYGALRLAAPDLPPPARLERIAPLTTDLTPFATDWHRHAAPSDSRSNERSPHVSLNLHSS